MKDMVGFEAEFFLRDKEGILVFPGNYGIDHDDLQILAEVRGEPGETPGATVANFLKEFYTTKAAAEKYELTLDLSGLAVLTSAEYATTLRRAGTKEIPTCKSIYGTDMVDLSDLVYKDGKLVKAPVSAGFHIHFSSEATTEFTVYKENYQPLFLQMMAGKEKLGGQVILYNRLQGNEDTKKTISASRITKPVIMWITEQLDEKVLPRYVKGKGTAKHRLPGWYELKDHGFEYRSLPFNAEVLKDLHDIAVIAFECLASL